MSYLIENLFNLNLCYGIKVLEKNGVFIDNLGIIPVGSMLSSVFYIRYEDRLFKTGLSVTKSLKKY